MQCVDTPVRVGDGKRMACDVHSDADLTVWLLRMFVTPRCA